MKSNTHLIVRQLSGPLRDVHVGLLAHNVAESSPYTLKNYMHTQITNIKGPNSEKSHKKVPVLSVPLYNMELT